VDVTRTQAGGPRPSMHHIKMIYFRRNYL